MPTTTPDSTTHHATPDENPDFYRNCLTALSRKNADFVIGGAYALRHYTGISRKTKDLDIFVRPRDCDGTLKILAQAGYRTEVVNAGWLAKAWGGSSFLDVIFRSGNGVAEVDDIWFKRATYMELFGLRAVPVSPPEEVIWSKAFTMERERFDLADVAHMIQAQGQSLDWRHLIDRFGINWRVLLSYIVLFGFIFPGERDHVPSFVMEELTHRLKDEGTKPDGPVNICKGTLLSGSQYLVDTLYRGYQDARFTEVKTMTAGQLVDWKRAIARELDQRLADVGLTPPEAPSLASDAFDVSDSAASVGT